MSNSGSATPTPINPSANASATPPSRTHPHDNKLTHSLEKSVNKTSPSSLALSAPKATGHPRRSPSLGGSMTSINQGRPSADERRQNSRSSPSSSSQGDGGIADTEAERSQPENSIPSQPVKKKRTRTLTTPHQSAVLHALLAQVNITFLLASGLLTRRQVTFPHHGDARRGRPLNWVECAKSSSKSLDQAVIAGINFVSFSRYGSR